MDPEKKQRRQSLKVIISEAFMVLTVILTVVILGFVVSGYWVNSDFEVKRQGMLQINSTPTGADVRIDGENSWLQKTNTSKVLASGEHTIHLSKEGYDSWTKTINIKEGLLYRVHYPRLFLKDRAIEEISLPCEPLLATFSPDYNTLLLIGDSTKWYYANINEEKVTFRELDLSDLFSNAEIILGDGRTLLKEEIIKTEWNRNGSHVLIGVKVGDGVKWMLINIKDLKNSSNLTNEFGAEFTDVTILDNDANLLLAVRNGNLHRIVINEKSISSILVKDVNYFVRYRDEIFFSAVDQNNTDSYYVGKMKINNDKTTMLKTTALPAKIAVFKFYEDRFVLIVEGNTATLYQEDELRPLLKNELSFNPAEIVTGHNGEFAVMRLRSLVATLDMESLAFDEWEVEGDASGWVDRDMLYSISDGNLIVYDYDGLNRRDITKNVSDQFPVAILGDRYLYYFRDDVLVREWLIPR